MKKGLGALGLWGREISKGLGAFGVGRISKGLEAWAPFRNAVFPRSREKR